MILTVVFAYAVGLLSVARALPNGAPLTSCGTIAPDPSGNGHQAASKSLASSPFNLNVTLLSRGYTGGTQYSCKFAEATSCCCMREVIALEVRALIQRVPMP